MPLEKFEEAAAVGLAVYTIAQEALSGFRSEQHQSHPKALLVTGTLLPFLPADSPNFMALSIQNTIKARLVDYLAHAYAKEGFRYVLSLHQCGRACLIVGFRFYFPFLVSHEGTLPWKDFPSSGPAHAKVFWELANSKEQGPYDYRYVVSFFTFFHYSMWVTPPCFYSFTNDISSLVGP